MQKKNMGGDLDWFYNDEKSPENIKFDPNKKKKPTFREKYVNKKRSFFSVQSLFKSVSFWVVVVIAVVAICFLYVPKTYENVASLERLSVPHMVSKTRNDIQKTVGNSQVTFEILSDCTIYGRVTDIQGYSGFSLMNRVSPKDIGISWGKLASKDNEAIWSSPGNRNLYFELSSMI